MPCSSSSNHMPGDECSADSPPTSYTECHVLCISDNDGPPNGGGN